MVFLMYLRRFFRASSESEMSIGEDDLDESWSGLWADWISEDLIAVRHKSRLHVYSISDPQRPAVRIV